MFGLMNHGVNRIHEYAKADRQQRHRPPRHDSTRRPKARENQRKLSQRDTGVDRDGDSMPADGECPEHTFLFRQPLHAV